VFVNLRMVKEFFQNVVKLESMTPKKIKIFNIEHNILKNIKLYILFQIFFENKLFDETFLSQDIIY